jgi:hypothetical protein
MMDNAIHVYKDTSLSKTGDFNLKDTVKNVVVVEDGSNSSSEPANPDEP